MDTTILLYAAKGVSKMSEITQGILIALIPALAVSIITSFITVKLSLRQFYSQRWWEKRAEAYSEIMEHLSYLQFFFDEWADEISGETTLSEKKKKELSGGYRKSRESIIRAAAIGAYIVSDTTTAALATLLSELRKEDPMGNWAADNDRYYTAVKECIATIREDAKTALLRK